MIMASQATSDLPQAVSTMLQQLVESARAAFGDDLRCIALYGSAAERRLRATSDVNVMVVLTACRTERAAALAETLRAAEAAIRLRTMFILESELQAAAAGFAVKFADIQRRHRMLYGEDPFTRLTIPRAARLHRLRQTLLNQALRLRAAGVRLAGREEQMARAIADAAGPLRAAAASLLELEAQVVSSPKEALRSVVEKAGLPGGDDLLARLSQARESGALPPGTAPQLLFGLIDLAGRMRARVEAMPDGEPGRG